MDVGVGAVAPKLKGAALRYRSPSSTHWETLFLGQVTASQAHTLVFRQQRTFVCAMRFSRHNGRAIGVHVDLEREIGVSDMT